MGRVKTADDINKNVTFLTCCLLSWGQQFWGDSKWD